MQSDDEIKVQVDMERVRDEVFAQMNFKHESSDNDRVIVWWVRVVRCLFGELSESVSDSDLVSSCDDNSPACLIASAAHSTTPSDTPCVPCGGCISENKCNEDR